MNYTYDESLKVLGDFLEARDANYAVQCAWEVVSNNQQYTQEELDDAYNSGYSAGCDAGNEREYDLGYEDGYAEGYEDAKAEYGCWSDE